MRMIAPRTGAPEVTVAEEQLEYKPLVVALYQNPPDDPDFPNVPFVLSRWTFTDDELARLLGVDVALLRELPRSRPREDVYIAHMTGGGSLQPLAPQVGPTGYVV